MARAAAPPGWYEDPPGSGSTRWWDGNQWTHHTLRATDPVRLGLDQSSAVPWWRTKLVLLVPAGALVWLVMVIGLLAGGEAEENLDTGAATSQPSRLLGDVGADAEEGQGDRTAGAESSTSSTAAPTSATTAAPTTAVPTTAPPTTAVPTTAPPTTAVPTTAPPTTAPPTTAAPTTVAPTTVAPTTAAEAPDAGCHPAYSPCLPNHPGDALNCGDLNGSQKPVTVNGADPYGLDGDNDGVGCESG